MSVSNTAAPTSGASHLRVERRGNRRDRIDVAIGLMADTQFYTGFTQNISTGGLFLATKRPEPIGSRFRVAFRVPTVDHEFQPLCEVCWHRDACGSDGMAEGMGVRFLDLTGREVDLINEFIAGADTLFYPEDDA